MELTGKIQNLFKGCPKPDGWFGCWFLTNQGVVQLTGKTNLKIAEGTQLKVNCNPVVSQKTGKTQYVADSIELVTNNKRAIIAYLSGPTFPGIGITKAEQLYHAFPTNTLDAICDPANKPKLQTMGFNDDMIALLVTGISNQGVDNQIKKLLPNISINALKELKGLYGITKSGAVHILKTKPYQLLYDLPQYFRFETIDEMALNQLGFSKRDNYRLEECIRYAVHCVLSNGGDVCLDLSDDKEFNIVMAQASQFIADASITYNDIGTKMLSMPSLVLEKHPTNNHTYLYEKETYTHECDIAKFIRNGLNKQPIFTGTLKDINKGIASYENLKNRTLDDEQKQAVRTSLLNRISIIKGGPGRGKTTVIDCILYIWQKESRKSNMAYSPILSAPTGRAVRRLAESVDSKYDDIKTLARRIVTNQHSHYKKDAYKKALFVIDETSMVGIKTAAEFLEMCDDGQVIFVGDENQLPSIECGQFFKDLCALDAIPKTILKTCHRVSGDRIIIENADDVNDGKHCNELKYDPDAFMFYSFKNDDEAFENAVLKSYLDRLSSGAELSEIAILCPTNGSLVGVKNLNYKIQSHINPEKIYNGIYDRKEGEYRYIVNGYPIQGTFYSVNKDTYTNLRVGDRVMFTENQDAKEFVVKDAKNNIIDRGLGLFNGDCGTIVSYQEPEDDMEENYITFVTDDGRIFELEPELWKRIVLAYAITIHKSQGCEYDSIIFVAQNRLAYMQGDFASRNLFYTAITRAKRYVEIIGSQLSVNHCIDTLPNERHSLLKPRILGVI